MQLYQCTSSLRMQTSAWFWITKLSMTSASVPLSSPLQAVSSFLLIFFVCVCVLCFIHTGFHSSLFSVTDIGHLSLLCNSWRSESPNFSHHEWCNMLSSIPWSTQLRSSQTRRESHSLPSFALLHGRVCPSHFPWIPTVQGSHRARIDPTNVGCQEHDVCS